MRSRRTGWGGASRSPSAYQAAYRAHLDAGAPHRAGVLGLHGLDPPPAPRRRRPGRRLAVTGPPGPRRPTRGLRARLPAVPRDGSPDGCRPRRTPWRRRSGCRTSGALRRRDAGRPGRVLRGTGADQAGRGARKASPCSTRRWLAALSDTLEPMWTGAIYCGLLDACHELVDLRRAQEWTEATRQLVRNRCRSPRCTRGSAGCTRPRCSSEQGAWEEAEVAALGRLPRHGEHRRVRDGRCLLRGRRDPSPARRPGKGARGGLRQRPRGRARPAARVWPSSAWPRGGWRPPPRRSPVHWPRRRQPTGAGATARRPGRPSPCAAGDLDLAEASAVEVAATAAAFASPGLCGGRQPVLRVPSPWPRGSRSSRWRHCGWRSRPWQELDAPHEVACTRVLLAEAYEALGDDRRGSAGARRRSSDLRATGCGVGPLWSETASPGWTDRDLLDFSHLLQASRREMVP